MKMDIFLESVSFEADSKKMVLEYFIIIVHNMARLWLLFAEVFKQ